MPAPGEANSCAFGGRGSHLSPAAPRSSYWEPSPWCPEEAPESALATVDDHSCLPRAMDELSLGLTGELRQAGGLLVEPKDLSALVLRRCG